MALPDDGDAGTEQVRRAGGAVNPKEIRLLSAQPREPDNPR